MYGPIGRNPPPQTLCMHFSKHKSKSFHKMQRIKQGLTMWRKKAAQPNEPKLRGVASAQHDETEVHGAEFLDAAGSNGPGLLIVATGILPPTHGCHST